MKIDELKKYENKDIILNLINKFGYKGKIIKIYDSSFDFKDIYGNTMTISPEFVGMVIPIKEEVKK